MNNKELCFILIKEIEEEESEKRNEDESETDHESHMNIKSV
jgi:hypothetical protein